MLISQYALLDTGKNEKFDDIYFKSTSPKIIYPFESSILFIYTEKMLFLSRFYFIILSNTGRLSAAANDGNPKPIIPANGASTKASPIS